MTAKAKTVEKAAYVWALLRIGLGAIFLWAFLDKLFGLGFATCRNDEMGAIAAGCADAYIEGGSPTTGFLKFATQGPFEDFYKGLAGNSLVDLLFMAGLLGIGVALILGIGVKLASIAGSIMMLSMWKATLWPENNPLIDDHIIYTLVLAGIYLSNTNQKWGLRDWWVKRSFVKNLPILE